MQNKKILIFSILIVLAIIALTLRFVPFSFWFNLAFPSNSQTQNEFIQNLPNEIEKISVEIKNLKVYDNDKFGYSINYPSAWAVKELDFLNKPQGKGVRFGKVNKNYLDCEDCFGGAEIRVLKYDNEISEIVNYLANPTVEPNAKLSDVNFLEYSAKMVEIEREDNDQYMGQKTKQKIYIFEKDGKTFTVEYRIDSLLNIDLDSVLKTFKFIP